MRHCHLHGGRNIDDNLVILGRLPYIQNGVANLYCIVNLCLGEAFRAVFKGKIAIGFIGKVFQKLCTVNGNLLDFLFTFLKHLLSLCHGCGIVKMDNGMWRTLYGLKGLADDVLSRLCQYLDGNVIRYHFSLDQLSYKVIFGFGSSGEAHFNFLKSDIYKHLKEFQLFL